MICRCSLENRGLQFLFGGKPKSRKGLACACRDASKHTLTSHASSSLAFILWCLAAVLAMPCTFEEVAAHDWCCTYSGCTTLCLCTAKVPESVCFVALLAVPECPVAQTKERSPWVLVRRPIRMPIVRLTCLLP